MHKWIFAVSFGFLVIASTSFAAREKRQVIIITSELSFIKYDSTFYMCDNDTPAAVTELAKNCVEVSEAAFNYALNTTDSDVMELQLEVDKKQPMPLEQPPVKKPQTPAAKPAAKSQ